MIAAGVDDAEIVPLRGDIKRFLGDDGRFRIGKIDGYNATDGACHLIHQSTGLAEEGVLRVLRHFGDFHVVYGAAIEHMRENSADHVLKGGGGGKSRAFEHGRGGVGVKTARQKSSVGKGVSHACDDGRRGGKFRRIRCGIAVKCYHILRKTLALDAHCLPVCLGGNGDDVQIDRGGDNTAVVVVGVVAGKLAAPRHGEEGKLPIGAVKGSEGFDCFYVALSLCADMLGAVQTGELFVKVSRANGFYKR